ncbi:MAG: hypothetical protein J1F23_00190 [Oscillospiraceae bacterium]|nr:hypothetical protein [Oscillospiraceae bacterium]
MSNKCPKCGEKLSIFYMKQTCPKCGANLVYYDLDKRLEADHERAIREQEAVDKFIYKLKLSSVGGAAQIIRLVLFFSPLLCMLLPMFITADGFKVSLLSLIMGIISGELPIDRLTSDMSYLFPAALIVCVIVFSLAVIISSLFSTGRRAFLRNMLFSVLNTAVFVAVTVLAVKNGAVLSHGTYAVSSVYALEFLMHTVVNNKIKAKSEE